MIGWRQEAVRQVYPRIRGESRILAAQEEITNGLPPHTRGIRYAHTKSISWMGSTPAYAGNPMDPRRTGYNGTVYPRIRGESRSPRCPYWRLAGLPPHTRGIRISMPIARLPCGSTPAYAGNPHCPADRRLPLSVYPRIRGESALSLSLPTSLGGLPPHTRGILSDKDAKEFVARSTPAYAGNPRPGSLQGNRLPVYPRIRGESMANA